MQLKDFSQQLLNCGLNHDDLSAIFDQHFGSSTGSAIETEFRHGPDVPPALIAKHDENGGITSLEILEGFSGSDLEGLNALIDTELHADPQFRVWRTICFGRRPFSGHIEIPGWFNLCPVPALAPQSDNWGNQPLILEVRYQVSKVFGISSARRERRCREVELLLAALIDRTIHSVSQLPEPVWARPSNGQRVQLSVLDYRWPGFSRDVEAFDRLGHVALPRAPAAVFYGEPHKRGFTTVIPDNFEELVNAYIGLSNADKARFLRSAYWYQHSSRVAPVSRSASYSALVIAIETLLPPEPGKRCERCDQMPHRSTARFARALEKLTGDHFSSKELKDYYGLRSRVLHGDHLLNDDLDGAMMFGPQHLKNEDKLRFVSHMASLMLVNWLIERSEQ